MTTFGITIISFGAIPLITKEIEPTTRKSGQRTKLLIKFVSATFISFFPLHVAFKLVSHKKGEDFILLQNGLKRPAMQRNS